MCLSSDRANGPYRTISISELSTGGFSPIFKKSQRRNSWRRQHQWVGRGSVFIYIYIPSKRVTDSEMHSLSENKTRENIQKKWNGLVEKATIQVLSFLLLLSCSTRVWSDSYPDVCLCVCNAYHSCFLIDEDNSFSHTLFGLTQSYPHLCDWSGWVSARADFEGHQRNAAVQLWALTITDFSVQVVE